MIPRRRLALKRFPLSLFIFFLKEKFASLRMEGTAAGSRSDGANENEKTQRSVSAVFGLLSLTILALPEPCSEPALPLRPRPCSHSACSRCSVICAVGAELNHCSHSHIPATRMCYPGPLNAYSARFARARTPLFAAARADSIDRTS